MASWLEIAKAKLSAAKDSVSKFMNTSTINGIGAALALVAMADGKLDPEEETAVITEISSTTSLGKWTAEIAAAFTNYVNKLRGGTLAARGEVASAINAGIKPGSEAANITIATMISIGGADGNFDPKEQKIVRDLAGKLQVDLEPYADLFNTK